MEDETAQLCAQCGAELHATDKFCHECGQPVSVVDVVTEVQEVVESAPDGAAEPTRRRSRRVLVFAGVAALGMILAAAAWWGLTQNTAAKDQYSASGPVLIASLDDMSGVQSTRMVRDVAGAAQQELAAIQTTLEQNPDASGADRLTTLRNAFAALAALTEYEQTNTEVWPENRPALQSSLDTLGTYGGSTESAVAEGEDAIRTLDDLTRRIDKAMAKYRKQVRKAKAQARSVRQDVRAYHAQMESLIDRYTALRNDTGAFVDRMDAEQIYMFEVTDFFTAAAADRRDIANQMAALRAPADLRAVHTRIVTVIGDGADAIDSAVAALEDAECYDGECYFRFNTQWQQFQSESARITARYGQAYDAWQAAIAKAERQARKTDLPAEPNL